jgi:hypothetical protein
MTTSNHRRMTAEEAQAALHEVEQRLVSHADGCDQCRAARYGQIARMWQSCPTGLELFRSEMALQHRINYLALRERRRQPQVSQFPICDAIATDYPKEQASA